MLIQKRLQLSLPMTSDSSSQRDALAASKAKQMPAAPAPIDQLLSTADVIMITGHHRCTIYRWIKAGTFPPKRGGGGRGWLRSDVEEWLATGAVGPNKIATLRRA